MSTLLLLMLMLSCTGTPELAFNTPPGSGQLEITPQQAFTDAD
ncbi:MAG: hypothetical protein ACI9VR_004665, partial [Cognaticolwellia sp.]